MSNIARALMCLLISSVFAIAVRADEIKSMERGNEAFHRGQYELAIFEYRGALMWPGEHQARARFNIGVCHYKLGHLREAVNEYQIAIKMRSGQYTSAFYALGVAFQDLRRHREAREAFTQAVETSKGKHALALFELGLYSQRDSNYQSAVEYYRQAIAQSKDGIPACHNNLGVIFVSLGYLDEAMREFEISLKQSRGKFAEARDNLDRCRNLDSSPSKSLIAALRTSEGSSFRSMACE